MLSREQMVSAKLFMRNYKDAFNCIRDTAEKENSLEWYSKAYSIVHNAKESEQINYVDGEVISGKNWSASVFQNFAKYSNELRQKYFPSGVQNFDQMNEALEKGIADLKG